MNTGVILARFQPIHNGHLALIEKACLENDEVLVLIGSADKFNVRNPLPIGLRSMLVSDAVTHIAQETKTPIYIRELDDLTDETDNSHDWGFYLYSKIVTITENPCFTMYYSDGYEIITTWFPGFILRNNISLNLLARNSIVEGISATKVRQLILDGNDDELKKYVPNGVFENRKTIKQHIEISKLIK